MLSDTYRLNIDENKEEMTIRGTNYFPCTCYRGDIHQFFPGYLPIHWHNELEVFHLNQGNVKVVGANMEFILQAGESYFSNAGALHGIYPLEDTPCLFHSIVFDASIIGGATGSAFDLLYVKPFIEQASELVPLKRDDKRLKYFNHAFEYAYENCEKETENYEFAIRNGLSEVFLMLKEKYLTETEETGGSHVVERIKRMVTWMEENYSEDITISMIASVAGISIRESQRCFREIMHTSPMHYLLNIRISKAMRLLQKNEYTISQIAFHTGFGSSSYFSKQFKDIVGKTPRQYKESFVIVKSIEN